mgnify:FL=1
MVRKFSYRKIWVGKEGNVFDGKKEIKNRYYKERRKREDLCVEKRQTM